MQELEKILEEIDQEVKEYMEIDFGDEYNAGIKDMAKMAKKIIRKHMNDSKCGNCSRRKWYQIGFKDGLKSNDGWIPVDERTKKDYTAVFAVDKHDYYFVAVYDKEHGYRTNDVGADVDNIVAYCLFNPYRPERSEE